MSIKSEVRDISAGYLRGILAPGAFVSVVVTRVNAEGSARWLRLTASVDNRPCDITSYVASVTNGRTDKYGALYIPGGGMDMRFVALEELGDALYSDRDCFNLA